MLWSFVFLILLCLCETNCRTFDNLLSNIRASRLHPVTTNSGVEDGGHNTPTYIEYVSNGAVVSKGASSVLLQVNAMGKLNVKSLSVGKRQSKGNKSSDSKKMAFGGLIGVYQLPTGWHLLMIRDVEATPFVAPFRIFKAKSFEFVKIPTSPSSHQDRLQKLLSSSPVSALKRRQRQILVEELLLTTLRRHRFYFSDHNYKTGFYDLTQSFESNFLAHQKGKAVPAENGTDSAYFSADRPNDHNDRFFWNALPTLMLREKGAGGIVTRTCSAFIDSFKFEVNNVSLQYYLLSRRSKTRQGPRYIKRGADKDAEVANFVESEQIIAQLSGDNNEKIDNVSSFRQIRGSIPLRWSQPQTWKLQPPILLDADEESEVDIVHKNMHTLLTQYCTNMQTNDGNKKNIAPYDYGSSEPKLYLVNLIDKKGSQGELGRRWFNAISSTWAGKDTTSPSSSFSSVKLNPGILFSQKNAVSMAVNISSLADRSVVSGIDFEHNSISPKNNKRAGSKDTIGMMSRFIWFDYHYQVKQFGVESLRTIHRVLLPALSASRGGFFVFKANDSSRSTINKETKNRPSSSSSGPRDMTTTYQHKIIRSNCVDCLDRTNVMQATIARWVLLQQLTVLVDRFTTTSSNALVLPTKDLEAKFRSIWADNGDHLSTLYAGSRAMKRDVTRTGKRTRRGMVDDAVSFAQRYVANNYRDSVYQRTLDFLLGLTRDPDSLLEIEDDELRLEDTETSKKAKSSIEISGRKVNQLLQANVQNSKLFSQTTANSNSDQNIDENENWDNICREDDGNVSSCDEDNGTIFPAKNIVRAFQNLLEDDRAYALLTAASAALLFLL